MPFVVVKYADEQKELFNHNCKNSVLLGNIRERCGLDPTANIDLSDEHGYVKQLHYNPDEYANNFLRDRETCVLLKVNRLMGEEEIAVLTEDDVTYTPLLDLLTTDQQFLDKLNPKNSKHGKNRHRKNNATSGSKRDNKKSNAPK